MGPLRSENMVRSKYTARRGSAHRIVPFFALRSASQQIEQHAERVLFRSEGVRELRVPIARGGSRASLQIGACRVRASAAPRAPRRPASALLYPLPALADISRIHRNEAVGPEPVRHLAVVERGAVRDRLALPRRAAPQKSFLNNIVGL